MLLRVGLVAGAWRAGEMSFAYAVTLGVRDEGVLRECLLTRARR